MSSKCRYQSTTNYHNLDIRNCNEDSDSDSDSDSGSNNNNNNNNNDTTHSDSDENDTQKDDNIATYCYCDKPHLNGEKMIGCDYSMCENCLEWHHIICIDMSVKTWKKYQNSRKKYKCPECSSD